MCLAKRNKMIKLIAGYNKGVKIWKKEKDEEKRRMKKKETKKNIWNQKKEE